MDLLLLEDVGFGAGAVAVGAVTALIPAGIWRSCWENGRGDQGFPFLQSPLWDGKGQKLSELLRSYLSTCHNPAPERGSERFRESKRNFNGEGSISLPRFSPTSVSFGESCFYQ